MIYRLIHYLFPGHVHFLPFYHYMYVLAGETIIDYLNEALFLCQVINMVIRLKSCTYDTLVFKISPILTTEKHVHKPLFAHRKISLGIHQPLLRKWGLTSDIIVKFKHILFVT